MASNTITKLRYEVPTKYQEFTNEVSGTWQAESSHREQTQESSKPRHRFVEAAVIADQSTMSTVIQLAHGQKQGARGDSVIEHLQNRTLDPLPVEGKDPERYKSHVGD